MSPEQNQGQERKIMPLDVAKALSYTAAVAEHPEETVNFFGLDTGVPYALVGPSKTERSISGDASWYFAGIPQFIATEYGQHKAITGPVKNLLTSYRNIFLGGLDMKTARDLARFFGFNYSLPEGIEGPVLDTINLKGDDDVTKAKRSAVDGLVRLVLGKPKEVLRDEIMGDQFKAWQDKYTAKPQPTQPQGGEQQQPSEQAA